VTKSAQKIQYNLAKYIFGVLVGVLCLLPKVYAFETSRESEINECAAGEIANWGDGVDKPVLMQNINFLYISAEAPFWFDEKTVAELIQRAATAWSACGVGAKVSLGDQRHYLLSNEVVIQWSDAKSQGNIGAADVPNKRLYLSPSVFKKLREIRPTYDSRYTLQMTLSHEMGHFYGLVAHSKRCVDVLSYYKNNAGELCTIRDRAEFSRVIEYRSALPTACDIERCRRVNGF